MPETSAEVRPLGGTRYEVCSVSQSSWDRLMWRCDVTYQPSDGWKPEIACCNCGDPKPCEHIALVIEWRRSAEG